MRAILIIKRKVAMKKQPHFNPDSKTWIISLIVMIVISLAVIFGSNAIYNQANGKPAEGKLTVSPVITIAIDR